MDIGITGGQDGPTAVFVGGSIGGLVLMLAVITAGIAAVIWLTRRKRKK